MPEAVGAVILQILKIITPDDISRMSKVVKGSDKVSLTEILSQDINILQKQTQATLPPSEEKKEEEKDRPVAPPVVLSSIALQSNENEVQKVEQQKTFRVVESKSTSQFFLEEKEKNRRLIEKLAKMQTVEKYQEQNLLDVEQERLNRESLQESNQKGILLNKKHY